MMRGCQDWTATWTLRTIMGVFLQASRQVSATLFRRLGCSGSSLMLTYSAAKSQALRCAGSTPPPPPCPVMQPAPDSVSLGPSPRTTMCMVPWEPHRGTPVRVWWSQSAQAYSIPALGAYSFSVSFLDPQTCPLHEVTHPEGTMS